MTPTTRTKSLVRNAMLAAAVVVAAGGSTQAGAPLVKGQAPGWFRMMVGDFEVTALSDGTAALPIDQMLTNTTPDKVKKALAASFLKPPLEVSVNGFLVNTGTKLVLIDTGSANLFGPTVGKLIANLKASGYQPAQVDEIYITHMHIDHLGGITAGDKLAFPNAIVRYGKADGEMFLSQEQMDKAPEQFKQFFKAAQVTVKPWLAAGKVKTIDGPDVELVPGVRAIATPGHTPGHTIYTIESKGEKMVFWGDLMHVAAVQFPDPAVTVQFDIDSKAAAPQRKKVFAEAAAKGHWVAAAHVSFPGIGHLRAEGKGYVYVPVNYTANNPPPPPPPPAK